MDTLQTVSLLDTPTITTMLGLYGNIYLCDFLGLVKHACRRFSGTSMMI